MPLDLRRYRAVLFEDKFKLPEDAGRIEKAPPVAPLRRPVARLRGYLYAALAVAIATILRILLARLFGYYHPYVTFYIAVLLSAWYGGLGPGLMATGLGALFTVLFILPHGPLAGLPYQSNLVGFEFYFIVAITATILFEAQRRAHEASTVHARLATERLTEYEREAARRRLAEEAASRAEEQFRVIVEEVPVGIARLAADGRFTEVNPELCAITGHSREEALALTFDALTHPDDRAEIREAFARLRAGQTNVLKQQLRLIRKDRGIIWADVSASMVRDQNGSPLYALAVIRDETERRRVEEHLREAQKLESIGLLAGGIAHDFNNLLTGILGNASLAMQRTGANSNLKKLLDPIIEASERAANLTRQLLAYAGKRSLMTCWSELSGLTRKAVELSRTTAPPGVSFRLDLRAGLPLMLADPSQIQQLVTNLIVNAVEAIGDREGEVRIRTGALEVTSVQLEMQPAVGHVGPGQYVFVAVEDTGAGMDEATRQRMFDPFFTTKFTGRGLGLAAVSGIVRAQRGAVLVESRPAEGTLIEVLFPVARNQDTGQQSSGKAA